MKKLKAVLYCLIFALFVSLNIQCKENKKEQMTGKSKTKTEKKVTIVKSEFGKRRVIVLLLINTH